MKTLDELSDFYYKTLHPTLKELDKERKKIRNKFLIISIALFVISLLFIYYIRFYLHQNIEIFIFIGFGYVLVLTLLYKMLTKEYKKNFKHKIMTPLVLAIDEKLTYSPKDYIPKHIFERSQLFRERINIYRGDDYVQGYIDGTKIEFSDIDAQKEYRDAKGNIHHELVFKGLFIVAQFNKNFNGRTVVLPDTAQSVFGNLVGGWLQSNNASRDELVKMDNNEFEKEFVVYSTDQIEARYILSHTMMKKLLHLKAKSNHPVYVSFVDDYIHIAISYKKDMFEASVFHSLLEYKIAMEYIQTLHLSLSVVEELKLNQKLWSKQ